MEIFRTTIIFLFMVSLKAQTVLKTEDGMTAIHSKGLTKIHKHFEDTYPRRFNFRQISKFKPNLAPIAEENDTQEYMEQDSIKEKYISVPLEHTVYQNISKKSRKMFRNKGY